MDIYIQNVRDYIIDNENAISEIGLLKWKIITSKYCSKKKNKYRQLKIMR